MTEGDSIVVGADMRWPRQSGIGQVQEAYLSRRPARIDLRDAGVRGRIGSPFSPLAVSAALRRSGLSGQRFWSAGFVPPAFEAARSVVVVHDLTHLHFYGRAKRLYYDAVFRPLYRRCAAIVCVSRYTTDEVLGWSGVDPARVHTIHNGLDGRFAEATGTLGLPFDYVLYCGNRRAYKNLDRLVEAYAASGLAREGVDLALTGPPGPDLAARARDLGVGDRLRFLGMVADEDMPRLYRGARAVAYVSLYEGFGLPILEAMACGVPVVTSNVSAMPEIAGDAGIVVDPRSVEAVADGLWRAATDGAARDSLVERGRARAASFDWTVSAARMWSLVETIA